MKRIALCLLFVVMLTACATPQTVEPTSSLEAPAVAATLPPLAATEIPFAALSPEEQAAKFLSGEITSITSLDPEQHAAFSLALTEHLNASAPIVSFNNKEAYINPDTLEMLQYADGVSEADKKFETFVAVREDVEGNLYCLHQETGEYRLIPNSAGIDWTMIVDDQEDTGITWPTTETFNDQYTNGQNMTFPQRWLSKSDPEEAKFNRFFTLVILLDKQVGNIFLDIGMGKENLRDTSMTRFGKPLLDTSGKVIAIEEFLVIADSRIYSYVEEEAREDVTAAWVFDDSNPIIQNLNENQIYYLGLKGNQGQWLKDLNAQAFPNLALNDEAVGLVKDSKAIKTKVGLVEIRVIIKKSP